jgi:hypothetical protein
MNKKREYWSECEQVYFLDGWAWGLTEKCQRICLGKEPDIKEFLDTHIIPDDLPAQHRQVLAWIKEYREENGFGKQRYQPKKPGHIRSRPIGTVKRRAASIKQAPARRRVTVH